MDLEAANGSEGNEKEPSLMINRGLAASGAAFQGSTFMITKYMNNNFKLGSVRITSNAASQINTDDLFAAFYRFKAGDWGDVCHEDRKSNDSAIDKGRRILGTYTDRCAVKFWILTESDRSVTTILLPKDY